MTKPHILFVHEGDNWIRGSERVLLDMIDAVVPEGYAVMVCCNSSATALIHELAQRGIPCSPLPLCSLLVYGGHNIFRYLKTCIDIFRVARRFQADLIHASSGLSIQYCLPAAKLLGIPSISHVQGVYLRSSRILSMASFATRQLFVSKAIAVPFTRNRERQVIFYNGIDSDKFSPSCENRQRLRTELGIAENQTVVGFVGSLEQRKGIATLFQIAVALRGIHPDIRFLIAGGGPLLDAMIAERDQLGLQDVVTMLGERSDTPALVNAFDFLVCPSTSEAFGLVAAEASSAGIPVVASNIGGLPEIVIDGSTGFLCDVNCIDDFIGRSKQLVQDPALRKTMGRNARDGIVRRFSLVQFRANLCKLYAGLLDSH